MRLCVTICIVFCCSVSIWGRPPLKDAQANHPNEPETKGEHQNGTKEWDLNLEYNRYLQEIVQVLEGDADFRKKLEEADVEKIRDGSIAEELDFVHHKIRNKLDDIKRKELERLRHLAMKQYEMGELGFDKKHMKMPNHIEIKSPTFEKEDLIKLIKTTTKDLEEADKNRREEFKKYEMEKKFEQHERLNHIQDEEKRKEEEARMKEMEEKHKKHEKPHHPMTKDQIEEVWEEQDHMRPEDFDPKTFFAMHDLNSDGQWDEDELKILFQKELDKVYDPNAKEDDMIERNEEMERMREHVFKESDKNKDRLISFDEFVEETKREEFNEDPGWDTLDNEDDVFSDDEYRAYEMQRQREIQDMINRGIVPQNYPYYGDVPPGVAPYQLPQQQMGIPGQPAFQPDQMAGHPMQGGQQFQQPGQFQGHPQAQAQFQQQGQPGQFQQGQPGQFQGQPQGQPQAQFQQQGQGQPGQFQGQPQTQFQQQGQPQAQFQQQGQPQAQFQQGQAPAQPQGVNQQQQGRPVPVQQGQPVQQQQQYNQPGSADGGRLQPGDLSRQYGAGQQQKPNSNEQLKQANP